MNTPRSKPPPRYSFEPPSTLPPAGVFYAGIGNDKIASVFGRMVSAWPHVEDQMITIFQQLTRIPDHTSALQIFRAMINQRTRIDVMKTMLQKSPLNQNAGTFYDEVIEEFAKLNTLRNTYAHGLWWTRSDGRVFFLEADAEVPAFGFKEREIEASELEIALERMTALIHRVAYDIYANVLQPSPTTPPQPSSRTESESQEAPLGFAQGLPRPREPSRD